jgi:hypothetical protein
VNVKQNSIMIREAISFAWAAFKKHYLLLVAILLTIFAAWVVLEIIVIAGQRLGLWWWIVAHLAFLIVFAGIEVGLVQASLDIYENKASAFTDTFKYLTPKYLKLGLKFLAGQILYGLIVLAGLVLLVIPGLYVGARYAFVGFCQVDVQESLQGSFAQSAILSTGNMASLTAIIGSLLLFNVMGACLLGIGLLVTIPLSVLTMTAVYKQLRG